MIKDIIVVTKCINPTCVFYRIDNQLLDNMINPINEHNEIPNHGCSMVLKVNKSED